MLSTKGWQPNDINNAGQITGRLPYRVLIPVGSPELFKDDIVTLTASLRDASAVGEQFIVDERNFTTMATAMAYFVDKFDGARPR